MKLRLWENEIPYYNSEAETPNSMETYFIETDKPLPCVVVLPGGAYAFRAPHEGEPVAQFYNTQGMHAVVVDYRVAPNIHPAPLSDAQRAIKILRAHAEEWKIDPERIVILGFSAGGHLAASTMTLGDATSERDGADEVDKFSAMPNGAILCYPVISVMEAFGHVGSGWNLLGERYHDDKELYSLESRVTENTPKAFLWHTSDDSVVPVKNSLIFAEKLRECGIPFEMHIYPHGRHGLGLAEEHEDIRGWAALSADWIWRNI